MSQLNKLATPFPTGLLKPNRESLQQRMFHTVSYPNSCWGFWGHMILLLILLFGMLTVLLLVASVLLLLTLMDELPRYKRLVSAKIRTTGKQTEHV